MYPAHSGIDSGIGRKKETDPNYNPNPNPNRNPNRNPKMSFKTKKIKNIYR